ncbi:Ube3a, partial [Symbiodinium microadriaticum]
NGGDIAVTNDSREEYVALYVDYLINKSVNTQFEAFKGGFKKVCGGAALDMFSAVDLELLICGNPVLDFEALKEGTRYEDGYDGSEQVIVHLWEVLLALDDDEKKLFLKFVSGSDRSPIDGLSKMGFVISRNGDDDSRLPSAHTCFNHLLLPQYSSKEVLSTRVKYCIQESEGFGLM